VKEPLAWTTPASHPIDSTRISRILMLLLWSLRASGINHVRGMLLYGPPGCGKTLIARQIGKVLNAREPKIINGPEVSPIRTRNGVVVTRVDRVTLASSQELPMCILSANMYRCFRANPEL